MNFIEFKKYFKELFILALPIFGGSIGQMLIGVGDVYVSGHYNTQTLASISVASAIFMTFIVGGIGLCSAISPVLSNYSGKGQDIRKYFKAVILYSILLSIIFFFLIWALIPLVYKFNLNAEIAEGCITYLKISSYSVFFFFLFSSLKEFLQSLEIVIFPNFAMIISVFINLILNWVFVFGFWIIPEMGINGLALSSLIVRMLLGAAVFIYSLKFLKYSLPAKNPPLIKELVKIGTPIGGAMFIEFFGFNIIAVLLGRFESVYAACHNIVITYASLVYMLPFALSNALSVKIGFSNGSRNISNIKKYTLCAFYSVALYAVVITFLLIYFRQNLMEFFTTDKNVIDMGVSTLIIVGGYTIFDNIQSICMGALKGLKFATQILCVEFLSYALIAIPMGLILAYKFNFILKGFWFGLGTGLFCAAVASGMILIRKYFKLKKEYNA